MCWCTTAGACWHLRYMTCLEKYSRPILRDQDQDQQCQYQDQDCKKTVSSGLETKTAVSRTTSLLNNGTKNFHQLNMHAVCRDPKLINITEPMYHFEIQQTTKTEKVAFSSLPNHSIQCGILITAEGFRAYKAVNMHWCQVRKKHILCYRMNSKNIMLIYKTVQ